MSAVLLVTRNFTIGNPILCGNQISPKFATNGFQQPRVLAIETKFVFGQVLVLLVWVPFLFLFFVMVFFLVLFRLSFSFSLM